MFKKLILVSFLIMLSSCSIFSPFGSTSKTKLNIPKPPERGFEEIEDIRKNIDVIAELSTIAHTSGMGSYTYNSETLLKSAKVLQTVAGLPVDPINWKLIGEVEDLHEDILERESSFRVQKADWESLDRKSVV